MTPSRDALTVETVIDRLDKRARQDLREPFKIRHDEWDVLEAAARAHLEAGVRDDLREDYPFRCEDCGRAHILDTSIPSEIWNQIAPDISMLCPLCIDRRMFKKGLTCEAEFYFCGQALQSKLQLLADAALKGSPSPQGDVGEEPQTSEGLVEQLREDLEEIKRRITELPADTDPATLHDAFVSIQMRIAVALKEGDVG